MSAGTDIRTVRIGPIEALERPGTGAAVVLLHGIGSNAGTFRDVIGLLPGDTRVLAWNAPGYGQSEPLAMDWPLARDYAAALRDILDRAEIGRATVLGHSLGALIAAAFAAANRDRVTRLILASPALGHGVPRGAPLSPAAQARIDDLVAEGPERFAAARAARLIHDPERNTELVARARAAMAAVRLPGYAQAARMLASGRLLDDAAQLTVPTDVIVGAEDVVTPPEGAESAHAAIRVPWRGRLTLVPGAGHALPQQAPGAVADLLAAMPHATAQS